MKAAEDFPSLGRPISSSGLLKAGDDDNDDDLESHVSLHFNLEGFWKVFL